MRRLIHDFFRSAESPVNLAIFRIVLFGYLFVEVNRRDIIFWSSLPADLRFPPPGVAPVLRFLPVNPSAATAAFLLFSLCAFTAMIGFEARLSAAIVALTGTYLLGLANLYGKINHDHHLVWFACVLAASPCAEVLSVDALRAAASRAAAGSTEPPPASWTYALPRRLVWLLFGLIYLGPGFWKLRSAGLGWAWSDNPKFILYNKWAEFHGWLPAFRIDRFPLLYRIGALGTILFEISFVFLVLHPLLRPMAVAGGLLFHSTTYLTMRIGFPSLVICYVVFPDWGELFQRAGRRLFPAPLRVCFDGRCGVCGILVGALRRFDVMGRIRWIDLWSEEADRMTRDAGVGPDALCHDLYAFDGDMVLSGFLAYRALSARVPVLWPALPFFILPPAAALWRNIHRRVADHRVCRRPDASRDANFPEGSGRAWMPPLLVGGSLLLAVAVATAADFNSWPIARYPTFAGRFQPEVSVLSVQVTTSGGREREMDASGESTRIPPERWMGLVKRLAGLEDAGERDRRLRAFWRVVAPDVGATDAREVRVYRETIDTTPGIRNPVKSRVLLAEFEP